MGMPQQAMQTYAPEEEKGVMFTSLSKQEEEALLKSTKYDYTKAQQVLPQFMQAKQDALFIQDRRKIAEQLADQASKTTDKYKSQDMLLVAKQSQLADAIRIDMINNGFV
jgi:hypothetical protein